MQEIMTYINLLRSQYPQNKWKTVMLLEFKLVYNKLSNKRTRTTARGDT